MSTLREAVERLADECERWAACHHASAVSLGYPEVDDGDMDAGLADGFNHALFRLRAILAEHPEKVVHISPVEWVELLAEAWDKGYEAGEEDAIDAYWGDYSKQPNPYREAT